MATMTTYKSGGTQNATNKIGIGNGKGKGLQNGQGTQNALQNMTQTETINERYFYDGVNVIADYNDTGTLLATYVTPFLDQNLTKNIGSNNYYYVQDGLGSVRNIVSSSQSIQNSYDYTAFGEVFKWTESFQNRYTYTGREWDKECQTYYYRARTYNPKDGRFNERDPIGYKNGINWYEYVNMNPVNLVDPRGKQVEWIILGLLGIGLLTSEGCGSSPETCELYEQSMSTIPTVVDVFPDAKALAPGAVRGVTCSFECIWQFVETLTYKCERCANAPPGYSLTDFKLHYVKTSLTYAGGIVNIHLRPNVVKYDSLIVTAYAISDYSDYESVFTQCKGISAKPQTPNITPRLLLPQTIDCPWK